MAADCQNGVKWLKVVSSSQESVEWPEECRTALKAPSNQNGNEGSQQSARGAPSGQQNFERPMVSKGLSAVRSARFDRVRNSLQVALSVMIGERGVVVSREDSGKSGEWLVDRRATGIRDVADEPE